MYLIVCCPVFVESCRYAVAVNGNGLVERLFGSAYPFVAETLRLNVGSRLVTEIEIAVSQRTYIGIDAHPIVIHAERTHHHLAVMTAQVSVERHQALCFDLKEYGIDELYHIIPAHTWQCLEETPHE